MPKSSIGQLREKAQVIYDTPQAVAVTSITRSGTTATVTTTPPHGWATNDYITHAGAAQSSYNVRAKITVTGATAYTFTVAGSPDTPATGTVTATYYSDAQGGRRTVWQVLDTVGAELMPIRASERLQLAALQSTTEYRFRVRMRADITTAMRLYWTPSWLSGAANRKTLAITGIVPYDDGRTWMWVDAGEVP